LREPLAKLDPGVAYLTRTIGVRLALGVVTVILVSVVVFTGTEILPGDVATAILGQFATPEAVAAIRRELGLDDPAYVRYGRWLAGLVWGDFGNSLVRGTEVSALLAERGGTTVTLAAMTAAITVPTAVILGLMAARYPDSKIDKTISTSSLVGVSLPDFLIGLLLVSLFSIQLGWLPAISTLRSDQQDLTQILRALALPAAALFLANIAHIARMTRAAMVNIMSSPAIEMALLKGVSQRRILLHHALPNAVAPIANVIAINMAHFIAGIVVLETMFNINGLGKLMVDAVASRDIPTVQACAMIFCTTYVVLNLTADLAAILANPRIRHPK